MTRQTRRLALGCLCAAAVALGGTSCARKTAPPGAPPTPRTVSKKRPGGNAYDPHRAALSRQLAEPWGFRMDKDRQAHFPLPDHKHWTRVRFGLIKHFTGFRFGKHHHTITGAFVIPLQEGDEPTSASCLQRFEEQARPQVDELGGLVLDETSVVQKWQDLPLVVKTATGKIDVLFKHYEVSVAWAGYPAYPDSCMIYAVAVPWRKHRKLAEKVRDRWVKEGLVHFLPLTTEAPFRHK